MRYLLCAAVAVAAVAAGPTTLGAADQSPIDTQKLVVKPTKAVADLTAATINMAGQTAASQIEKDGYFKTLKNLLKRPTPTTIQAGPSRLPAPTLYPSTQYKDAIKPVMPINMPARRR